jgi:hypothetical protein
MDPIPAWLFEAIATSCNRKFLAELTVWNEGSDFIFELIPLRHLRRLKWTSTTCGVVATMG